MKKLLLKLKLIQTFRSISDETAQEFEEKLSSKIDYSTFGFFSDATDVFSSSKNRFKGFVIENSFKLKHKRTFFSGIAGIPVIQGRFYPNGKQIQAEIEINALTGTYWALCIIALLSILINTILLAMMISGKANFSDQLLFPLIFSATIFPVAIYISMRSALRFLRKRISTELFHLEPTPNIDV